MKKTFLIFKMAAILKMTTSIKTCIDTTKNIKVHLS